MMLESKEMQLSQKSRQVNRDGVGGALYLYEGTCVNPYIMYADISWERAYKP